MFLALWRLANDGQNKYCIKGSREYEKLKIKYSQVLSIMKKGRQSPMKGKHHTETEKEFVAQKVKDYWKQHQRIPWNKGTKTKKVVQNPNSPESKIEKKTLIRQKQGNIIQCRETGELFNGYESLRETLIDFSSTTLKRYIRQNKPIKGKNYFVLKRQH